MKKAQHSSHEGLITMDGFNTWLLLCVSDMSMALSTGRSPSVKTAELAKVIDHSRHQVPQSTVALFELRVAVSQSIERCAELQNANKLTGQDQEIYLQRWNCDAARLLGRSQIKGTVFGV